MDPIKVCMIAARHNPLDSRIFYKEGLSLKKAGYDVTVIGKCDSDVKDTIDGVHIIGIKGNCGIRSHLTMWKCLLEEALRVNAEIYHCHDPESFLVSLYIKIFRNKKVIHDVHEYYTDLIQLKKNSVQLSSIQMKMFLIPVLYFIEPLFCRRVDAIIAADEGIAERYRRFNQRVYTIFNFPTFDTFKPSDEPTVITKYENNYSVIYIGGLAERRGIFDLIKAIQSVSRTYPFVKLLLVGRFETEDFKSQCLEYVKSNELTNVVEFIGYIPHNEISDYINASDVGAVCFHPIKPLTKTAYPIKLFEYMICGKPVIASDLPAMGKIVKDLHCGILVNPMDIDEIANKIIFLLNHPDNAKKMGEYGREAVEHEYNWNRMCEKLVSIYEGLI